MSLLGDAIQTLNEDVEVIAFLPGVNYVFLHIASGSGSDLFFGLALAASVVGAALFNHLRSLASGGGTNSEEADTAEGENRPDEWEDPRAGVGYRSSNGKPISQRGASISLFLVWGGLLLVSMYYLLERFSKSWVLPEVLFFISIGFTALYATDAVLKRYVSGYDG